jgi:hypothetical protein
VAIQSIHNINIFSSRVASYCSNSFSLLVLSLFNDVPSTCQRVEHSRYYYDAPLWVEEALEEEATDLWWGFGADSLGAAAHFALVRASTSSHQQLPSVSTAFHYTDNPPRNCLAL